MRQTLMRLALCGVFVLAVCVLAGRAGAADPTDDDKKRAGELYKEGDALFKKELYSAAIEAFKKAHAIVPHSANLYNIARSYEKLGDSDNCVSGYQAYVDFYKRQNNGQDPKDIVDVRASIAKCQLLQRPKVSIGSDPPGAKVYLEDKEHLLGQTPFETTLDPGRYKIVLELDLYVPAEETIEVRAGQPFDIRFRLEKFQRTGSIRVKSNVRGASIFIDGRNIGLTPYTDPITVDEGAHQVSLKKDEYTDFNREVKVAVNKKLEIVGELYLRDSPYTWKGYVGWISLALGAGGVAFGVVAGMKADDYFNDTDDFDTWSGYQKLGYGLGGGLMGAGLGLLIWEATDTELVDSEDELDPAADSGPRVTPILGAAPSPRGGGAQGFLVGADVRF